MICLRCVLWSDCRNPAKADTGESRLTGPKVKWPIAINSERTDQTSPQGIYSSAAFYYHIKSHAFYWGKKKLQTTEAKRVDDYNDHL